MRRSSVALAAAVAVAAFFAVDAVGGTPTRLATNVEPRLLTPADVEAAFVRAAVDAPVSPVAATEAVALSHWSDAMALLGHLPNPPQAARDLR